MPDHDQAIQAHCDGCGALMVFAASQRTGRCPFCDAPSVLERPAAPDRPLPTFALGFTVEQETAAADVTRWIAKHHMGPFGLKTAVAERVTGTYLPAYLYSATARSRYEASIAERYVTTDWEKDSDGKTRMVRREETEYRDLSGTHVTYVADVLVTASRGVPNQELSAIEPFNLSDLRRYSPGLIAGWTSEEPSLSLEECKRLARAEAESGIASALHRFMPGDGVRDLRHQVEFQEESLDPALVPVWVFALRYHARKPPIRILVNGQTGQVGGVVPLSRAKLGLLLGICAGLVALLILLLQTLGHLPR